jgi:23S rRNA pseudouridine1911/1915/1917 synthase
MMNSPPRIFRFDVSPLEAGRRLDQAVSDRFEELSRTLVRRIIDLGGVHVAGRRVRKSSLPLKRGDRIEIYLDGAPLDPFRLSEEEVLFRDPYLIAVSKPAGVETQPTHARYKGTLYEALLTYLHDPFRPMQHPDLGMVQRLDRDTSGVLVFSTHPKAHAPLTKALSEREAIKVYLALVTGVPVQAEGEISSNLQRIRGTNRVRSVKKGGKEALTRYRVLKKFAGVSLLEVQILTGRSHQIRAHLSEAGHPLLGDLRYDGPSQIEGAAVKRQMLHSWRLEISHPVTGEALVLEAPLPSDLSDFIDRLTPGT